MLTIICYFFLGAVIAATILYFMAMFFCSLAYKQGWKQGSKIKKEKEHYLYNMTRAQCQVWIANKSEIQKAYACGYLDAMEGREYGHSW